MPRRTDYPQASDIATFLRPWTKRLPADDVATLDFVSAAADAQRRWEQDTNYSPFLARPRTLRRDPPGPEQGPVGAFVGLATVGGGRRLFVREGMTSVESVTIGVRDAYGTIPAAPGTVLAPNIDYFLRPSAARDNDQPYKYIEFTLPQWGNPNSIAIQGTIGYMDELTEDIWAAVLRAGALAVIPQLEFLLIGLVKSWQSGVTREEYFQKPFDTFRAACESKYAGVLGTYQRKSIV